MDYRCEIAAPARFASLKTEKRHECLYSVTAITVFLHQNEVTTPWRMMTPLYSGSRMALESSDDHLRTLCAKNPSDSKCSGPLLVLVQGKFLRGASHQENSSHGLCKLRGR